MINFSSKKSFAAWLIVIVIVGFMSAIDPKFRPDDVLADEPALLLEEQPSKHLPIPIPKCCQTKVISISL